MTKEERLLSGALDACPSCGAEKKWYSQHWAKAAECNYPEISDHQHEVIQGLLLSDGSIEGNPKGNAKFRFETAKRPLAEWAYDELDWLATGLDRHERPDGADQYRVLTLAHPDVNRYRNWYDGEEKRPPAGYRFSPTAARAFHACDGNLSFGNGNRPHVEFRAADQQYGERLVTALAHAAVETTRSGGRVRILAADVTDWLAWIGDPVPGVAYKWADGLIKYHALRSEPTTETEYRAALCRAALGVAREQTDQELTPAQFDQHVNDVDSAMVADVLGGGSWGSALRVAGVSAEPTAPSSSPPYQANTPTSDVTASITIDERDEALREAAADVGEPLTMERYAEWREGHPDEPSEGTIVGKWGWRNACKEAGVAHGTDGRSPTPRSTALQAIQKAADAVGEPLTLQRYDEWRAHASKGSPLHSHTIARRWGWVALCNEAGVEPGRQTGATLDDE